MSCLFCKMVNKEISANVIFENDHLLAFHDIKPQAPTHILIIPKKHIANLNEVNDEEQALLGQILLCAKSIAQKEGFADKGYRLVFNTNADGGQEIYHIHLHLLAGRQMNWPPG